MPNSHRKVQGGKPNCSCVPSPDGLGDKLAATANTVAMVRPVIATARRLLRENRSDTGDTLVFTITRKARENSGPRTGRQYHLPSTSETGPHSRLE